MTIYDQLFRDVEIPGFYKVSQSLEKNRITDIQAHIRRQISETGLLSRIHRGDNVALTAGSREIANIAEIMRTLCDCVKEAGGKPFIIPAMGSHGGAVAENQKKLIAHFGITEEAMGVPVRSSMETVFLGYTEHGLPVYFDKLAAGADAIIPVGRIKVHTCFHGKIESGIMKMLAVGCGKQKGASVMHEQGFGNMSRNVTEVARVSLEKLPVIFGVGIVENGVHDTYGIYMIPAEKIEDKEAEILDMERSLMPRIPFDKVDVLIVDEIGKNISGTGMDANITGRSSPLGISRPFVERLAVLDLTQESEGSAFGMGNADVITRRMFDKIRLDTIYPNGITSHDVKPMMIPVVMPNDKNALQFAIATLTCRSRDTIPKIVWLHNTLCMEEFYVSKPLWAQAQKMESLSTEGKERQVQFDENGDIIRR